MKILIFTFFLSPTWVVAEEPAVSTAPRVEEIVEVRQPYVAPIFELGPRSQSYGALLGVYTREGNLTPHAHGLGYSSFSPMLKGLVVAHDDKIQGGMAFWGLQFGGGGFEWLPSTFDFAVGSAFGMGDQSIGVFEAGYLFGTPDTLQVGVISYTPLSTNNKPAWFPDWTITVRYPLSLGKPEREQITSTRKTL